jgi:hypothetical protein
VTGPPAEAPFRITVAKVIALEAIVLVALWLVGRHFSG